MEAAYLTGWCSTGRMPCGARGERREEENDLNKILFLQVCDLGVIIAEQLLEDRVRVLTEARSAAPDLTRGAGHLGDDAECGDFLAERLILVLDEVDARLRGSPLRP